MNSRLCDDLMMRHHNRHDDLMVLESGCSYGKLMRRGELLFLLKSPMSDIADDRTRWLICYHNASVRIVFARELTCVWHYLSEGVRAQCSTLRSHTGSCLPAAVSRHGPFCLAGWRSRVWRGGLHVPLLPRSWHWRVWCASHLATGSRSISTSSGTRTRRTRTVLTRSGGYRLAREGRLTRRKPRTMAGHHQLALTTTACGAP